MSVCRTLDRTAWLIARKALYGVSLLALAAALPAAAQTLNDRLAARSKGDGKSKMLVDAREVVYDRDNDRVTALGDVQVYYQGRVLEADRVTYDRKTKRVLAVGNAKITDTDGTKTYGDRFELTDDFKDGFIDSLRSETTTKSRFSAPRAERSGGERTVFENATFTGCAPCKDNPERPPLWQIKAARIIHNNSEQRIYYENASFEFFGLPVAWLPFFSSPDPSVSRLSGLLAPNIVNKTRLGTGVSLPYFVALAPNYDVTLTPTYFSRQGFLGDVLWRHRLENGSYSIRANAISQMDRSAFAMPKYLGAGDRTFRGSLISRGLFYLNEKWTFGWDASIATDKFYYTDYKVKPTNLSSTFFSETISSIYLRGRGERSWFDLSTYHILGLSTRDWRPQAGFVAPSFDFDRRFTPSLLQGELRVTANGSMVHRDAAYFQALPFASGMAVPSYKLYADNEGYYQNCGTGNFARGRCLLRGVAGDYARASLDVNWRRRFVDPLGQEWTPFFGARADVATLQVNTSRYNAPAGSTGYGNAAQSNFFNGNSDNYLFRGMPMFGLEYRYPFFAATSFGTHHIEPIGQIIVRPDEMRIGKLPNEDSQSLVFDEYNLFATNKFSGFDRVEGGTRANYGARYSFRANNGTFASLLLGQSVQIAGRNSFSQYDLANTGRNSGLDSRYSNYVAAVSIQPTMDSYLTARGRFDEKNFSLRRLDVEATAQLHKGVSLSALYTRIAPQPELGFAQRREGLALKTHVDLPRNFYASGGVLFDMDYYLTQRVNKGRDSGIWNVSGTTLGLGYKDDCVDLSLNYIRTNYDYLSGTSQHSSTYMVSLTLKDLGEASLSKRITSQ